MVLGKQPFHLNSGGVVQLTTLMLSLTDPDTSDRNLLFVITQLPEHGWIVSDGHRLENFGDSFSMDELVHGKVAYLHGNGAGEIDSIGLNIAGQESAF